ncbi:AAA family ATPase [Mesorhizobium sp. NZP2298]|uniref:AAA family ATPase n=1 Tax=Mesorhizobium sp. NZP2298 TaxID=2483403 RepID=UPI0015561347|nr:ATP-binding protein [Mesorhizobium sp. NZP2298]QKC98791.1 ATP-binding protein [Mesorhizobium sp. NZP2298]
MTNSRQVIAMIRSHVAGDSEQFLSIAEHIAADAVRSGKTKVADEIKEIVEAIRKAAADKRPNRPIPIGLPRGELAGLVRATYPEIHLADLVLGQDLRRRIVRLIREHRESAALEERGLEPRRKFLFSGPPGTGKSMTASAIAGELGLPLFTILLDGVITKFMGETAAKLRLVFDAMHNVRGVYFFDEVDALASRRGADNDIGEARRMLNSFLQFLEEDQSRSVIIAATNHRALLDPAIFRRFHSAFVYARPTAEEARQVLRNHLLNFKVDAFDWASIDGLTSGLSQADLVAAAEDAARDAVLDNSGVLTSEVLYRSLQDRISIHRE